MPEKSPVFVGVDLIRTSGRLRRAFVYAALDADRQLLAIGHGDRNEILAYLGGQASASVAISAPRAPNNGTIHHTSSYQEELPFTKPDPDANCRLCEALLLAQGMTIETTPDDEKACQGWMRRGFDLYRQLEGFGYLPIPNKEADRHCLETHAEGIYWRLLGGKSPLPPSLEGRIQRQLILLEQELPVPDAMDFFLEVTRFRLMQGDLPDQNIYSVMELNALAAAHIAWLSDYEPHKLELLGDPNEGQIVLPRQRQSIL